MPSFNDKKNIIANILNHENPVLDIGCGPIKKKPEWIGVDMLDFECVDIVGDIFEVLNALPEGSISEVYSSHFFEHIDDLEGLLKALSRVLKKDGKLTVIVPHFSNPYFYSDYTHKRFFGLYTFSYLAEDKLFFRKVPRYGFDASLSIEKVRLNFKSPFLIRHALKLAMGYIFNAFNYMKEFYEENLSGMYYCYEIVYILRKTK